MRYIVMLWSGSGQNASGCVSVGKIFNYYHLIKTEVEYYFFRDLEDRYSLMDGKTHHAAGLVEAVCHKLHNPSISGNDLVVKFFNPFVGVIETQWRSHGEVDLFDVTESEHKELSRIYFNIGQLS